MSAPSVRAESDARYGGFDFRAAHEAAPADLRELLDNTESLPFRRRGYERDGMLRCVARACCLAQRLPVRGLSLRLTRVCVLVRLSERWWSGRG